MTNILVMNLKSDKINKKEQKNKNKKSTIFDGDDAWPMPDFSDAPRLKKNYITLRT